MDQVHSTTTEVKKGKHLSFEERVIIHRNYSNSSKGQLVSKQNRCRIGVGTKYHT